MKNGQQPAFSQKIYPEIANDAADGFGAFNGFNPTGLTKREYFAAILLQGILAGRDTTGDCDDMARVKWAIDLSDELLKQLGDGKE